MTQTTYGLEDYPTAPYWAKYRITIRAPDGNHHKFYQGYGGAEREFRRQIGHDPKNYKAEQTGDQLDLSNWSLQVEVDSSGYFEAVDDYGRVVTIARIDIDG